MAPYKSNAIIEPRQNIRRIHRYTRLADAAFPVDKSDCPHFFRSDFILHTLS